MKKKVIIFFIFLSFFSFFCLNITSVLAQTPINNTNFSQVSNNFSDDINNPPSVLGLLDVLTTIWSWLADTYTTVANFITNLPFFSKPRPTAVDTSKLNNDYTRDDKNINTRAMPEKIKKYRKGVWFYEVLTTKKYKQDDQLIENINQTNCPKNMRIADVIYFYYVNQDKYPKILYKRDQIDTPIDYPSAEIESLNVHLNFPDDCYINAYNNLPDVPIGWFFLGQNYDDDTSSLLSTQLNESVRTIMANNAQGETAPSDVTNELEARLIAEDTDKQERNMLLHLIPEKEHTTIPCGDNSTKNRNYLRIAYANTLYPENWPRNDFNSGKTIDGLTVDGGGTSSGENTASMSQHGSHGMSLYGYDYKQILSAYFGDVTTLIKKIKDESLTISVFVQTNYGTDSFDSCEKLRSGEKFMPNIEAGEGGFKLVSKHPKVIEECVKGVDYVPILETYTDPDTGETKTRETNKYQEKVPNTCRGFIKDLNLVDYLLGIAETPVSWHIEFQKAHIIVCRQHGLDSKSGTATRTNGEELGEWVYNNANTQAFRCDQANGVGSTSNLAVAVKLTNGEYVVSKNDGNEAYVSERSFFGRAQTEPPFFDGTAFENLSMIKHSGYYNSVTGICFVGIKLDPDYDNKSSVTSYTNNNLPVFNELSHQSPIIKKYDIANVDNGKWLETYSGNSQLSADTKVLGEQTFQNDCKLDSRIFPALNSLIASLGQDISDNQIGFNNCYRSITDQNKLWINTLKKWGSETEAIKYINKPGESPHHTGRAIDFADKNGKLNTNSSVYQWLVKNGSRFGFYNYQLEPQHWVYNP